MPHFKNLAAMPAALAALSLTIVPAQAAEMPVMRQAPAHADVVPVLDVEASQTAEHRRYHRYRYRRGPGLGDVLAGVLIVGAIAHVAKAATRDERRERDYRRDANWDDGRGIDRAVEMCVDAVDRERRVETVDRVDRTARGWIVQGTITRGDPFTCRINENGRVEDVDFGSRGARYDDDRDYDERYEDAGYDRDERRYENDQGEDDDAQWDDERYASEWSRVDRQAVEPQGAQPAYPGGPIEGDDADIDGDLEVGTGYPGAGV